MDKKDFPYFQFVPRSELERDKGFGSVLLQSANDIARWSDLSFVTPDGRTFSLFLRGESIGYRLRAQCVYVNKHDLRYLSETAGMILEPDSDDPPLIFRDDDDLKIAWAGLHQLYNVPLSREECEILELENPEDSDEDEDF